MGKQSWKPGNMLNPVPAVMVSVADEAHRPNIITVAWAGMEKNKRVLLGMSGDFGPSVAVFLRYYRENR